jgi:hypothetical protein
VKLVRNNRRQYYYFQNIRNHWSVHDEEELAYMGTMRDHIETIMLANQTTTSNYGFVIHTTYGDFYDDWNPPWTELDMLWASDKVVDRMAYIDSTATDGLIKRYNFEHDLYIDGIEVDA